MMPAKDGSLTNTNTPASSRQEHPLTLTALAAKGGSKAPCPGRRKTLRRSTAQEGSRKAQALPELSQSLLGWDPVNEFARNCERTVADWAFLLGKIRAPPDGISTDPGFIAAFRALDDAISGKQTTYLLRRLVFVEMIRLSDGLQRIVRSERDRGLSRSSGLGDASVVINIHKAALASSLTTEQVQRMVRERRRTGRRWTTLAGPSSLFLLVYPSLAETIV